LSFIKPPSENHCPGISDYIRPTVKYDTCNECGGRVEIWSDEETGACIDCRAKIRTEEKAPPCLEYCDYAGICKGIIMQKKGKR
jgi:hypothetical protein